MMSIRIDFVTNMCSHFTIKLFELLSENYNINFHFTGGQEKYWDKKNQCWLGKFNGRYLNGFYILPRLKITPALLKLAIKNNDIFIKTIDDRFALPFIFLLAKIRRKPFILWTQQWTHPQTLFHYFSFGFLKYIYRHSDAIVVYGQHVRKYLVGLGVREERIFDAPQSIDNNLFNKLVIEDEKKVLKDGLGLQEKKIILYVGRREPCKGLSYLIEACGKVKVKDFCVLFVGSDSPNTDYGKMCIDYGVPHLFLDHIVNTELYKYYAITDIFVLPSITTKNFKEPWGVVINEAMNQGCPIVATDAVGAAAGGLVENGRNGYIVPEKNSEALKEAFEKLLSDDRQRLEMGHNASEKISGWTTQRTVEGFEQAIQYVRR